MPGGRGGGRRCGVRRFLVPCLLVLLQRGPAHGYSLLSDLGEFGFDVDRFDPSLLYRTLHDLEAAELVSSVWVDDSLGPQKRDYAITPRGTEQLALWVEDLRATRNQIDRLLSACEDAIICQPARRKAQ